MPLQAANPTPSSTARRLRLRKRADLRVEPQDFGRRRYWAVKDPVSLRYYQLREEEYRIMQWLDGTTSLDEVKHRFERDFAPRRLNLGQLQSFIGMLHHEGLIIADAPGQGTQLLDVCHKNRRRQLLGRFSNVLAIRFRGLDPERLLDWLEPRFGWLFSPAAFLAVLALAAAALVQLAVEFDRVVARLPDFHAFFGMRNALLLLVAVALAKVLHELGHGLACKHYGGECHEMGLMFLVFTPCLYCNVSDAWMLPNKWHRVAISAAGMYVEALLASIATFLWWFSEPGLLNSLCLNMVFVCSVSTIVFNGNPLLRYDGYYILADMVEVPNLRQQSLAIIRQWLGRFFLDVELENPRVVPDRQRGWLALYAVAATIYRFVVVIAILWFLHSVLKPYRLEVLVQMLAVFVVGGMIAAPAYKTIRFLRDPARSRQMNWTRLLTRGGVVAGLVVAVGLIPFPFRVTVPVVIEPKDDKPLYVSVGGTLVESVRPGTRVRSGDRVGLLQNLEVDREIVELTGQRDEQEMLLKNLNSRRFSDPTAADQIPTAEEVLADVSKRLAQREEDKSRLDLRATASGVVLPPKHTERMPPRGELAEWSGTPLEEKNVGCFLKPGTTYCRIGDPQRLEAVLIVDQADVQFVKEQQRVKLMLDETPGNVIWGTVIETAPMNVEIAPRELLAHEDLPTRPDESGAPRPVSTSYQVRVALEPHERPLLLGAAGQARIHAEPQTLAARLLRYLLRTFRFDL